MHFSHEFQQDLIKLLVATLTGMIIGIEREYKGKSVGIRTITLICLGATLFTMISVKIGGSSPDRIAANIVTGVGFIGAGVIFKEGFNVIGLTTATAIWISAALGMSIGMGLYEIALAGLIIVVSVLAFFGKVQNLVDRLHEYRTYRIQFKADKAVDTEALFEAKLKEFGIRWDIEKLVRNDEMITITYNIYSKKSQIIELDEFLKHFEGIRAFDYA
jgi:putative Mg2+ transporter-C (MgtC) family protein